MSTRDKAILGLFINTGIRLTELASSHLGDVELDRGRIKVNGKGAKERFVFCGNKFGRLLWRYVSTERPDIPSDGAFPTEMGTLPYSTPASPTLEQFHGHGYSNVHDTGEGLRRLR